MIPYCRAVERGHKVLACRVELGLEVLAVAWGVMGSETVGGVVRPSLPAPISWRLTRRVAMVSFPASLCCTWCGVEVARS